MRDPVGCLGREAARDCVWPGPPLRGVMSRCCRLADLGKPQEPAVGPNIRLARTDPGGLQTKYSRGLRRRQNGDVYSLAGVSVTWVHADIYAGGGDHIPETWAQFADQTRIAAILHLRPGKAARFEGPMPAGFLWLNIGDESEAGMEERWLAGRYLQECLEAGQKVLIHSSLGRHRTRWAYVAYGIYSGRAAKAVLRQAAQSPWLSPYHTDTAGWQAFEQAVKARRKALERRPSV